MIKLNSMLGKQNPAERWGGEDEGREAGRGEWWASPLGISALWSRNSGNFLKLLGCLEKV